MSIDQSNYDYYIANCRNVESRLRRSVDCGVDNHSAYANLRFELKDDIVALRKTIREQVDNLDELEAPKYAPFFTWLDRLESERNATVIQWTQQRRAR